MQCVCALATAARLPQATPNTPPTAYHPEGQYVCSGSPQSGAPNLWCSVSVRWLLLLDCCKQPQTHRPQHTTPKGSMCVLEVHRVEPLTSGAVCLCAGYCC